jgi:hypothetical protein
MCFKTKRIDLIRSQTGSDIFFRTLLIAEVQTELAELIAELLAELQTVQLTD